MKLKEATKELFGDMRNLTEEEQESYSKGLAEISEDTGIQLFNIKDEKAIKLKGKIARVYKASEKIEDNKQEGIINNVRNKRKICDS